jgi:ribonuclease P/MRP protein subunit POP5
MKPRPPTMRDKRRYILCAVHPVHRRHADPRRMYYAIQNAVTSLWGDHGSAKIQMVVVGGDEGYVIVRCIRGTEDLLEAAIATVTGLDGERVALHPVAVSGTIRALRRRMRPAPPVRMMEEIEIDGRTVTPCAHSRQKVDLFAKGIKNQESLYFTHDDMEES